MRRNWFLWINITLLCTSLKCADFEFLISILFLYDQKISLLKKIYQTQPYTLGFSIFDFFFLNKLFEEWQLDSKKEHQTL